MGDSEVNDAPAQHLQSADDVRDFLESTDCFLFDCDGVLWSGSRIIGSSIETLKMLRTQLGKKVLFITNNSTKQRDEYVAKLHKLGYTDCQRDDILCSASLAGMYLRKYHSHVNKVYAVGEAGLFAELRNYGFEVIPCDPGNGQSVTEDEFCNIAVDGQGVGAVVCGWCVNFNFRMLCTASLYLQCNNTYPDLQDARPSRPVFIATNRDAADAVGGRLMPGNGSLVSSIEVASGVRAETAGKPEVWFINEVLNTLGIDRKRTVMIGDRLDTDILLGKNAGIKTLLVLSGVTKRQHLESPSNTIYPDCVISEVGMLYDLKI